MIYFYLITTFSLIEKRRILCRKKLQNLHRLAWNLLCQNCAKLIKFIKKLLFSKDFIDKHKTSPEAFTRQRKLPFHLLVCFLLNLIKGSYQSELDRFFQNITRARIAKRFVSKAALAKARMKLKFEAFIELNHHLLNCFQVDFKPITWHGLQLLAIDGCTVKLPKFKKIIEHFGVWNVRQGDPCPMARISQLFDPLNKITINAIISPKSIGERQQAANLFSALPFNGLVLLDRGYPAFWLFKLIQTERAHFCARVSRKWKIVRKFINSGKKEKIIQLKATYSSLEHCRGIGLDIEPLTLRLIRVELDSGEVEVLITSLTDKQTYTLDLFAELYHLRWPVEEDYKTMKCRMGVEAFTGKSVLSVYQDFHAQVFFKNLVAVMAFPIQAQLTAAGKKKQYEHQINFTYALGKAKHLVVLLFQRTNTVINRLVREFQLLLAKTTEPVRPGRKFPRNHKTAKKTFYMNYKQLC